MNDKMKIKKYKEQIKTLNEIGILMSKENDISKLLKIILNESLKLSNSDAGRIYLTEKINGKEVLISKFSINFCVTEEVLDIDENSISGLSALNGKKVVINNQCEINKFISHREFEEKANNKIVNIITIPMKNSLGKVIGIFQVYNNNEMIFDKQSNRFINEYSEYTEEDINIIESLASQSAILVSKIKLNEQLDKNVKLTRNTLIKFFNGMKNAMSIIGDDILEEQDQFKKLATMDSLTGLMTRNEGMSFLEKEIELAQITGNKLIVSFIDVNDLKIVNDKYGHLEGDFLLKTVASLIKDTARDQDFLFRYGGDEFILILFNADLFVAKVVKERINNVLNLYNMTSDKQYELSVSIGFSEYNHFHNPSIKELITIADLKMYEDKKRIKGK